MILYTPPGVIFRLVHPRAQLKSRSLVIISKILLKYPLILCTPRIYFAIIVMNYVFSALWGPNLPSKLKEDFVIVVIYWFWLQKISTTKGQLISKGLLKTFICIKNGRKYFCISALASKMKPNQKNKGTLYH